jgi:hypothetical protein
VATGSREENASEKKPQLIFENPAATAGFFIVSPHPEERRKPRLEG